jgi:radical SAM superfamily enzyme YgiQ (UPF0313 family)
LKSVGKRIVLFWGESEFIRPSSKDDYLHPLNFNSLTLASLAGALKDFDVVSIESSKVLEKYHRNFNSMTDNKYLNLCVDVIENQNPDIVGISSWAVNLPFSIELSKKLKSRNPDIIIILGGYPSTFNPKEVLEISPEIDLLVRGEGEITIKEVVQKLTKGEKINKVNGLSFRDKDGNIVHTPNRKPIENLDQLPLPDYESFLKLGKIFAIYVARGCNRRCIFCSSSSLYKYLTRKSIKRVMKEIELLNDYTDFEYLLFMDNNFTSNNLWLQKFIKNLPKRINWECSSRIDTINENILKKLKNSGCVTVSYGVENIIPKILKFLNKTNSPEKYIKKAWEVPKKTSQFGMKSLVNGIIGTPIETKKELLKNLQYFVTLQNESDKIKCHGTLLTLFPGTIIWKMYNKGEIKVTSQGTPNRFFAKKYSHLPWAVPEAYFIENENMSFKEFYDIKNEYKKYGVVY